MNRQEIIVRKIENRVTNNILLKIFLLLCFITFLNAREIRPKHYFKKTTISINQKNRTYYQLHSSNPLEIKVEGYHRLNIYVRSEISEGQNHENYNIFYTIDDSPTRYKVNMSGYSNQNVEFVKNGRQSITTSDVVTIQVDKGEHIYRFYQSAQNVNKVFARPIISSGNRKKIKTKTTCKPINNVSQIKLNYKGKTLNYYRILEDSTAVIEIEGPRDLVFYNRLEFLPWMMEPTGYRIKIREDGNVLGIYQLSSKKSLVTQYHEESGKVPGCLRSIVLKIPNGKHQYSFKLLDSHKSCLVKFRTN